MSFTFLAKCAYTMQPETTYPIDTSTNTGDKSGLSDPDAEPWRPDEDDESPTATITVDGEENTFIESVKVTSTENVDSVTVTVTDVDNNEVCNSVPLSICTYM